MRTRALVPLDGSRVGESSLSCVADSLSSLSPQINAAVIPLRILAPAMATRMTAREFIPLEPITG